MVAYLMEKETITGAEMVAIIEGRDPELVDDAYASTKSAEEGFRPSLPNTIEPAARKVHMISQKIEAPDFEAEVPAEEPVKEESAAEEAPAEEEPKE